MSRASTMCRRCVVVVAHGAGSSGSTARRLLAPLLRRAWPDHLLDYTTVEHRFGDAHHVADRLARSVARHRRSSPSTPIVLAGVSLGAHAAALSTLRDRRYSPDALVVALPAWIGPPDEVAELTRLAGVEIAHHGIRASLARIRAEVGQDPHRVPPWVLAMLERDWPRYTDRALARALMDAAESWAPEEGELADVPVPSLVVGLLDDPLHPVAVARRWSALIPRAVGVEMNIGDVSVEHGLATQRSVRALTQVWRPPQSPGGR